MYTQLVMPTKHSRLYFLFYLISWIVFVKFVLRAYFYRLNPPTFQPVRLIVIPNSIPTSSIQQRSKRACYVKIYHLRNPAKRSSIVCQTFEIWSNFYCLSTSQNIVWQAVCQWEVQLNFLQQSSCAISWTLARSLFNSTVYGNLHTELFCDIYFPRCSLTSKAILIYFLHSCFICYLHIQKTFKSRVLVKICHVFLWTRDLAYFYVLKPRPDDQILCVQH